MAWDAAIPTNSGLLINFPAQCRANWDAIATGTDASLLITNAKVSATAAITESKLLFSASGHGHTGGTDGKIISSDFQTGDWIISSVTTARTGWTNVSSTYSNKFMRINATPLSAGGADTFTLDANDIPAHTHAAGTLATASDGAHVHNIDGNNSGSISTASADTRADSGGSDFNTGSGGAHTHTISGSTGNNTTTGTAIDTVPVYVTVVIFQKD